jgi:hypothetical protein
MKKIIPVLLLASVALFILAGCDKMLEGIYPDQTGQDKGNNTFQVQAEVISACFANPYGVKVYFTLKDDMGNALQTYFSDLTSSYNGSRLEASAIFSLLPDGNYSVDVLYDAYGDNGLYDGLPDLQRSTGYYTLGGKVTQKATVTFP